MKNFTKREVPVFHTKPETMEKIMRIIRSASEHNPIQVREISKKIDYPENDNGAKTRAAILECMDYDQTFVPVCKNGGYYLARNRRQLMEYEISLQSRIDGIKERIAKLWINYHERKNA